MTPALSVVAHFRIDPCLKKKIRELWEKGIVTLACCCGHGKYPETIVIRNKDGFPVELNQEIVIRRAIRFYKRDSEGFYYIPECKSFFG